ncbi:copper resistance CopC/CopD family protein [Streptomyces griseorubiginosus]|uniref:copper resistance CopC/CopD family protein n=1 Tax=Streptomyces griseorubiginosus TaxID=67304 RepID=UPI002E816FE1|nr:copper resistance protein CopC [Streptomyces griseorubiginosus]WUB45840.1 copper resistance protein CopC [Streptomyces griseorubiginosus]WUB54359.1 copper resistance protein CopC [Streptomyces griseorubiginosus]
MTQTIAPRVRTLVLLLLATAGLLLTTAGPASAHAALTGSDPQQGVVVDKAPDQVSLTFSEQVALSSDSLRVLDPKGKAVQQGKPFEVGGTTYGVKVHSGLPDGTYTVTYQVVSADSHPVSGAFTFSVGAPSTTSVSVSGETAGGGVVGWLYGFGRYLSYAGFIVLVGGAAFVLACWQRGAGVRPMQRFVVGGWLTLTAATLLLLLLRGSYTSSGKVGDVFDLDLLGNVLQTKSGAALVSRLLLLAAAALFISVLFGAYDKREDEEKRDLTFGLAIGGTVVAAGLAASWAMAEHASVGLQTGIAMPVDVLHLLAVATWLGGLTALLVALYRSDAPIESAAVRRFSQVAFGSVVTLVATGVYQSWRQLGSWSAFTETRYGQLLLVKIGLVAVLVGIAFISRRWTAQLADTVVRQGKRAPQKERVAASASGSAKAADGAKGSGAAKKAADAKGGGSKRAAQLARQQAAMDTARQKRTRDADPHRFGLRRSVLAEAGVAVVLLAVTTVLTQTEPGRTEEDAKAAKAAASSSSSSSSGEAGSGAVTLDMSFDTGGTDGKGVVTVDIDPARVGGNEMHVYVQRPNGRAFDIPEVKVALTLEAKKIGPLAITPDHITTGHWSASNVQIPMAGDWKIAVTVRTSDIDQTTVSKNAQIG